MAGNILPLSVVTRGCTYSLSSPFGSAPTNLWATVYPLLPSLEPLGGVPSYSSPRHRQALLPYADIRLRPWRTSSQRRSSTERSLANDDPPRGDHHTHSGQLCVQFYARW